jgi:hypothetical protein
MAIIKTGDDMPVLSYIDEDGSEIFCDKCGKKLVIVSVGSDHNKLVCDHSNDEDDK